MELNTKFGLNDKVYDIYTDSKETFIPCSACSETGFVTLNDGKRRTCPECYGRRGHSEWVGLVWKSRGPMTIGSVRIRIDNLKTNGAFSNMGHYDKGADQREEQYMMYETGIGIGGSLYNVEDLFATQEEAEAECKRRDLEDAKGGR